jgi:uncharacterized membrane protein
MKIKIKSTLFGWLSLLKNKVVNSYNRCREGNEKLVILLLFWCLLPCFLYIYIRYIVIVGKYFGVILDILVIIIAVLDYYFIEKAVKIHPEYDTQATREIEKEKYYSTLSKEELNEAIKKDKIESKKNLVKRLLAIGGVDATNHIDFYKIVRIFVILVFFIAVKRLFSR